MIYHARIKQQSKHLSTIISQNIEEIGLALKKFVKIISAINLI